GFVQRIIAEEGEGCNLHGSLEVNKLAGNFHFVKSFHLANMHAHHESNAFEGDSYNISHRINKLSFGDPYPGILNPLDGLHWNQVTANDMYQYFIKVVATMYTPIRGSVIRSNHFSATKHYKGPEVGQHALPGVFFFYDLSTIKLAMEEVQISECTISKDRVTIESELNVVRLHRDARGVGAMYWDSQKAKHEEWGRRCNCNTLKSEYAAEC
ncbi:endoplasmic reticulum-Golgi intermediate compartment protein 3-like protein, partial [Tanacetum coccineum]